MARAVNPFLVLHGEGEVIQGPVGGLVTFKARAETTNGTFTALENLIPPQQGPPLHIHLREDEMYYVLEGHVRFKADHRMFDSPAGSFMFIPRGTPHCFQNVGNGTAKLLVMFTPAGMERFFEGVAQIPSSPPDPHEYRAVAHSAWMEVVGPPLADTDPL